MIGLENYGHVLGYPDLQITGLSEEHGIITAPNGGETGLKVGERLQIVPNHCCVVSNMVDEVILHRGGREFEAVKVAARGCIT